MYPGTFLGDLDRFINRIKTNTYALALSPIDFGGLPGLEKIGQRVRANLSCLLRNKRVVKTGERLTARWSLPDQMKEAAN